MKTRKTNKRHILITLICSLPIIFLLVLLCATNLLLFLAAIALILVLILIVKTTKKNFFRNWFTDEIPEEHTDDGVTRRYYQHPVRMVLTSNSDVKTKQIQINNDIYKIGRASDNDFKLEGNNISRHHVRIEYKPEEKVCCAVDVGSKRGTYLNDRKMAVNREYRLTQGDRLMIDDRLFIVDYASYNI